MAAGDALIRAVYGKGEGSSRGPERGIRGKELRFQQSRMFGPGAFRPYIGGPFRYAQPARPGFYPRGRFAQKATTV